MNWLSRLLTPLKLTRGEVVAVAAPADSEARGTASVAENLLDDSLRAPFGNARVGADFACRTCLGSSRAKPAVPA